MPILWNDKRAFLTKEYSLLHYKKSITEIVPQAIVIHWTASNSWKSAYNHFYDECMKDGTVNVSSHFLVDKDGTIYRLTPETRLNRHIIGYNWCAVGIENVGGVNGKEDLTYEQLVANIELIKYLQNQFPTIKYIFGHYQQDKARKSGLYIEAVKGYASQKIDPGTQFMKALRENLTNENLVFFEE